MTTDTITKTVFFNVPSDIVWSYLTDKDKLAQWFHPAQADLQAGEDYALIEEQKDGSMTKVCWGTVQHFDPPQKMVWSFTVAPLKGQMTTVTWTLNEFQNGTRLTMIHEGIGAAAGEGALGLLRALDAGWDKHFAELRSSSKNLQSA